MNKKRALPGVARLLKRIIPNKAAQKLPPEEWDFSNCPPLERYECFIWELSRDCEAIKNDVAKLRAGCQEKTFDAIWNQLGTRIFQSPRRRPLAIFYFCPEFPDRPYLCTGDQKERQRRINLVFGDDKKAAGRMLDGRFGLVPSDIGHRIKAALQTDSPVYRVSGSYELALISVDWKQPDPWLKEAFAQWLINNRPPDVETWPDRGAGVPNRKEAYRLKQIAARRLLKRMDWKAASELTATANDKAKPLFAEQSEWSEAEIKVAQWIRAQNDIHRPHTKQDSNKVF